MGILIEKNIPNYKIQKFIRLKILLIILYLILFSFRSSEKSVYTLVNTLIDLIFTTVLLILMVSFFREPKGKGENKKKKPSAPNKTDKKN